MCVRSPYLDVQVRYPPAVQVVQRLQDVPQVEGHLLLRQAAPAHDVVQQPALLRPNAPPHPQHEHYNINASPPTSSTKWDVGDRSMDNVEPELKCFSITVRSHQKRRRSANPCKVNAKEKEMLLFTGEPLLQYASKHSNLSVCEHTSLRGRCL